MTTAGMAEFSAAMAKGPGPANRRATSSTQTFLSNLFEAVTYIGIGAVVTAVPIVAHSVYPPLGVLAILVVAGACAVTMPAAAIVAVLFSFMFQNLVVSIISPNIGSDPDFDLIRSYNFFVLCITWLATAWRALTQPLGGELYRVLKVSTAAMAAIGVYFAIGLVLHGFTAVVYLRNIVSPLLFFQICVFAFATTRIRLGPAITGMGVLIIYLGFIEFFYRDEWLYFTNGETFWTLNYGPNWQTMAYDKTAQKTGVIVTGLMDTFKVEFFNSPLLSDLGVVMTRLLGPNMQPISFAYCLAFFSIFSLYRGRLVQAVLFIVLMFLCNAKGPIIMFVMVGAGWVAFRLFGSRFAFLMHSAAITAYALIGIVVGLQIGDFHVLGLMSGIHGIFIDPIGNGIGAGGNYSPDFFKIDWPLAQALGRTPFPVESSVGVLLYQMGVFALGVIGVYVWIAWRVMKLAAVTQNSLQAAAALSILSIVGNGLFQEEAYFSLLTLALFLGLAGMIIGAGIRLDTTDKPSGMNRELDRLQPA